MMKSRTMPLPKPGDGLGWIKVFGDLQDECEAIPDADGGYWIQMEPFETGGCVIDLSEHFKFVEVVG